VVVSLLTPEADLGVGMERLRRYCEV